jgi:hypothetical protein
MIKVKLFFATALVTTIAAVGLAAAPSASAMPMTCAQARSLARLYVVNSMIHGAIGDHWGAAYWLGRRAGVEDAVCY